MSGNGPAVGADGERPLVDPDRLRTWLEAHVPVAEGQGGGAPAYNVERHQAGHSNETFFVTWGPHELVLRRPPRGAFLPTAHDVLREHRVLSRLAPSRARVPKPLAACDDEDVLGAPFYLMERVHGDVLRHELPAPYRDPDVTARIGPELVDTLAELHGLDWTELGLEDIGRPDGYLERQVARWQDQWDRTRPHTEPVRAVPELDEVGAFLADECPGTQRTTLVHGDYKLDNAVFARAAGGAGPVHLAAVLDWEMATLGDPLADVGWMLSFWREPGDPMDDVLAIEPRITEAHGFAPRKALLDRYAMATGLDTSGLDWYVTLAIWKLAILLEGSYARHLAGATDDPFFAQMEDGVPLLARRALAFARGERSL